MDTTAPASPAEEMTPAGDSAEIENVATDAQRTPRRWDRSKWTTVFSSHSPTIRDITECLGLGLSPTASATKRGIPKFESAEHKKLGNEIARLSKMLPQEREELLSVAGNPQGLDASLDKLLETMGPKIWGRYADRSQLLKPDPDSKKYVRDLFYEDPADRDVLRLYIERWIIIKACYYIRNRKLKKNSMGDGTESVVDMDVTSPSVKHDPDQSPVSTPQPTHLAVVDNRTPPTEGGAQQAHVIRKRPSSAFLTASDQEDGPDSATGARKRTHHNTALPIQRKSPRKPFEGLPNGDDAPQSRASPTPNQQSRHPPSPSPDSSRSLTSPPPGTTAAALPSFAAVNAPPPHSVNPHRSNTGSTATSPRLLAAATERIQPHVPSNAPTEPVPPRSSSATAVTSSFAAVNAPNGFTAVNSSNPPAPHNLPSYASPYHAEDHARRVPDHYPPVAPQPTSTAQRENKRETSPQKQTAPPLHHRSASPYVADSHGSFTAIAPSVPHHPPQAYHSHHIPTSSATAQHIHPKAHPHVVSAPHGVAVGPGATNAVIPAHILPSNSANKPVANGHMPLEHPPPSGPPADTVLIQCELLPHLMYLLYPREGIPVDENHLLANIQTIWLQNTPAFRQAIGPLFDLQTHVLFAWIQERYKIMQLKYAMETQPGVPPHEMVDRLLAMNDLRIMRLKWKAMTTQDGNVTLSAEDLLCRAFAVMTKTGNTERLFKQGLENLNETVFGFLKGEDMKISLGKQR